MIDVIVKQGKNWVLWVEAEAVSKKGIAFRRVTLKVNSESVGLVYQHYDCLILDRDAVQLIDQQHQVGPEQIVNLYLRFEREWYDRLGVFCEDAFNCYWKLNPDGADTRFFRLTNQSPYVNDSIHYGFGWIGGEFVNLLLDYRYMTLNNSGSDIARLLEGDLDQMTLAWKKRTEEGTWCFQSSKFDQDLLERIETSDGPVSLG